MKGKEEPGNLPEGKKMEKKKVVISLIVDNQSNVLTRISSLFGRRGFNIDSLTVSATETPEVSRVTVVFDTTSQSLDQIIAQTEKLEVVRRIVVLDKETSLYRELLMVKVRIDKAERASLLEICDIYRARVVDLSKNSMIVELTGAPDKVDGFMDMISCYDIAEVCRTGITGIERKLREDKESKTADEYAQGQCVLCAAI